MAYNFAPRLGNIVGTDDKVYRGQLAVGETDSDALNLKSIEMNIQANPQALKLSMTGNVKGSVIPFLVSKTDNQQIDIVFTYGGVNWRVNGSVANPEDYGVSIDGMYSTGNTFTLRYTFRTINRVVYVNEAGKTQNISKRLVEVPSDQYEVKGPLSCIRGADFNMYTLKGVPFTLECTVKITTGSLSTMILRRYLNPNNFWELGVESGNVYFQNVSGGKSYRKLWTFKKLRQNVYHHLKFVTTSNGGFFQIQIDGIGASFGEPINIQTLSAQDCEVIAGSHSTVYKDKIVVAGVRSTSPSVERRMTVNITSGKEFMSEETYSSGGFAGGGSGGGGGSSW